MEVEENAKIFTQEVHFTDKFFQIVNREAEVSKNKVVLREIGNDHNIFLLNNLLSKEECLQFIKLAETLGFQKAGLAVNQQNEYRMNENSRNNMRVIVDDKQLADYLFKKVKHLLPPVFKGCTLSGLNERFRIYRYEAGQKFKPHFDVEYHRPNSNELSLFSFMIYLNEGCVGGETTFFKSKKKKGKLEVNHQIVPDHAIVFDHHLFHEGSEVKKGVKYAMRSDVMFMKPQSERSH